MRRDNKTLGQALKNPFWLRIALKHRRLTTLCRWGQRSEESYALRSSIAAWTLACNSPSSKITLAFNAFVNIPPAIENLVNQLARLPGIGQKTAQRLAFYLLRAPEEQALNLAKVVQESRRTVRFCQRCFGYAQAEQCLICNDPQRSPAHICVVEQPHDVFVMERMGGFKGEYHVLMGCISPLDGIGPEQLKINQLYQRVQAQPPEEVILATNPSLQGEATALHLAKELARVLQQPHPQHQTHITRITRLARGMPAGSHLEYADDITLNQAFLGRQAFGG